MTGIKFVVFFTTITITVLLALQRTVRSWWSNALSKKHEFFIVLLLFLAPSLGGSRGQMIMGSLPDATRSVRIAVIIFLFVTAIWGIFTHSGTWQRVGVPAKLMVAYGLFATASMFWSVDPVISLWKGFEILSLVLASIYVAGQIRAIEDIRWLMNMISLVMLFFVVSVLSGIVISPSEAFGYHSGGMGSSMAFAAWGIFPELNPNTVSQVGMLLATLALPLVLNEKKGNRTWGIWIIFMLGITAAILGHSRTSIFAGALAITGILFFGRHLILATVAVIAGAFATILASFDDLIISYIYRGQSQAVFETMSGRTVFWETVWEHVVSHPWFGQGFYAAHRVLLDTSSVDNTYLEILMDIGIVGLIVFALPVIITALTLLKTIPFGKNSYQQEGLIWLQLMSIFVILFLRSLTGPSFHVLSGLVPIYIFLIVGTSSLARLHSRHSTAPETEPSCSTPPDRLYRFKSGTRVLYKQNAKHK